MTTDPALSVPDQPPFARLLGIEVISASADEVISEMTVTPDMANRNAVMHGGAIMSFADNVAGTATFHSIPPGKSTVTVESKTNFTRAIPIGDVIRATCVPLNKGRTIMIWQTTITRGDGKVAAIVTQTQMVLDWKA